MVTFYIVRHGETLFNQKHLMQGWCDSPLTNQAVEDAKVLGKRLKDITFQGVYASSSERAWRSAQYIIENNEHPVQVCMREELKEINFGTMEGENEFIGRIAKEAYHRQYGWVEEGGENMDMVRQRVWHCLNDIAKTHQEGNVLIVTHGVVMMSLLDDVKPGFMEAQGPAFHIKNLEVMQMRCDAGQFVITNIQDVLSLAFDDKDSKIDGEHHEKS